MSTVSDVAVTRALLSVSDKTDLLPFAQFLHEQGIELLSTGGTARLLREQGLPVTDVADYTGFPEIMAGRVKTLHPKIHGGLLGRRGTDDAVMAEQAIAHIDLVVVNLYPFAATIAQADCSFTDAIENIDIGGPAMIRASAKNHAHVSVIVNPADYQRVQAAMQAHQNQVPAEIRLDLAVKAFEHTAQYDGLIANYLGARVAGGTHDEPQTFPRTFNLQLHKQQDLRYGENAHQQAAFYVEQPAPNSTVASATQRQGKALSYNNIADTDAALECVKQFDDPACVIVKHANPCGVAVADTLQAAYERAYSTDPESAFGGIIAFNRELDADTARLIIERQFVEVLIAPGVSAAAEQVVAAKQNVRLLSIAPWTEDDLGTADTALDFKRVQGGLLVQTADAALLDEMRVVTQRQPSAQELNDLLFAWRVAKFVKSNAIIYAHDGMTIGVGAGQMSRVNSARIAVIKAEQAGLAVSGSVMASDAFFPFRDGIDQAATAGIRAVIQPGGSRHDDKVIAAADEHGIAMVLTAMRHFRH